MAGEGGGCPAGGAHGGAGGEVDGFYPVEARVGEGGEEAFGEAGEASIWWGAEVEGFFGGPPFGREDGVETGGLGGVRWGGCCRGEMGGENGRFEMGDGR